MDVNIGNNVPKSSLPYVMPLISVVFGFILAKGWDFVRKYLTRPKLVLEFRKKDLGYVTHTRTREGKPCATVRVKVTNTRKTTARGCRAFLTNVREEDEEREFVQTGYCDSIPLAWSCQGEMKERFRPMDIPKDVNQHIDIIAIYTHETKFSPQLKVNLYRYVPMWEKKGTFLFTIYLHAENAKPVSCKVVFKWKGPWEGKTDKDSFEAISYEDYIKS